MKEKVRILLVDDSPTDIKLFQVAARNSRWIEEVRTAADGFDALEVLKDASWRPHLILIDLNMPRMNGFELLQELKNEPKLRSIPTVVLSTSAAPKDVAKVYDLQANSFLTKPADFDGLNDMLKVLEDYWHRVATLPTDTV
jgi:two-component system, chemotaxis family, response regulator Rcp1